MTNEFSLTAMDPDEKMIGQPVELLASHHPARARWMPTSACWETPWKETPRCLPARTM